MATKKIKFKTLKLGDIFEFKAIKQAKSQRKIPNKENGIPYVVQSQNNNMMARRVDESYLIAHNEPPVEGNAIVLGVTLPAVSYQPYKFGASQVITARNKKMNEKSGLYFVALLQKQMSKFSYTQKPGMKIYKNLEVKVPFDEKTQEIDFKYMEDRIKELEEERIIELEAYLKVTGLKDYQLTPEEQEIIGGGK